MEYTIVTSMKTGSFQGKFGETYKYGVLFDGEIDAVEVNQKPETPAPKAGDKLSGTIEVTQYGRRFKKESTGTFGAKSDPVRQESIEWQSARRDAVDYCIAKSRLLFDLGKKKEAEEELTGKHIFEVTYYFKGVDKVKEPVKNEVVSAKQEEMEDRNDDSAKNEIDISEIPFN